MSSLSLQCFSVRRNLFVFVFTIFNVVMYGLYVMDMQGDKTGVNLAPRKHFKEASIEQLEHGTLEDYEQYELQRMLRPTAQSKPIESLDIVDHTFKSPSLHTDQPRGIPGKPKIHNSIDGTSNPSVEYRSNLVKSSKQVGFQQSIQTAQEDWSRSSSVTSQDENNNKENSEISSGQSVLEKSLAIAKLTPKEQDSTSSRTNSLQNTLPLEKKDPNEEDKKGDITDPGRSFAKTLVTSSSRGRYTNETFDESTSPKVTSPKESDAEKALTNSSFRKEPQLEMNNLKKRTTTRTGELVTNVRSQPDEAFSSAQLGDILKDKKVQEDGRNVFDAPSHNRVDNGSRNVTSEGTPNVYYGRKILSSNFTIIYNAVPKCGSRTLQVSITSIKLKGHKRRKQFKNIPPPKHCSNDDLNSSCLHSFYMSMPPSSFVRPHVPYVSLPSNYIMINMLRDPLERFISLFFFRIYGDAKIPGLGAKKQDINDCVESGNKTCDPSNARSAMTYICGVEPACREITRWTLEKAKRNVERYVVVGYLEDIDSMLKVLEVLVPNQLSGLYKEYVREKNAMKRKFKTKQKQQLSEKTIDILKQKLALQYEFYNYIRSKFDHLKESLGIS